MFAGRVPYDVLPGRLRVFDICLSTQTNDVIGNVRTTGKSPLYLAAGRFVLASRVGEAARVLPSVMLVEFHGSRPGLPGPIGRPGGPTNRRRDGLFLPAGVRRAGPEHFDYYVLALRVAVVIREALGRRRGQPK